MLRIVLVAVALAVPSLAAAQNVPTAFCRNGALPFAATEANRAARAQLQALISGKRLGYVRESNRGAGVWFNFTREFRADGSSVHGCQAGRSAAAASATPPVPLTSSMSIRPMRPPAPTRPILTALILSPVPAYCSVMAPSTQKLRLPLSCLAATAWPWR